MLWLAGLMGLMAVGAVSFIEPQSQEDQDDGLATGDQPDPTEEQDGTDVLTTLVPDVATGEDAPQDTFEPDYDPRGGDDAALLDPAVVSEADRVVLTEGTPDDDALDGSDANDRLRGLDGADTLDGGAGNDELRGDAGDDTLDGGAGNDTLHGHNGGDVINGGDENDTLFGHNANDRLFGDAGDDALQGSAGDDTLDGGTGDDSLQGGLGNDNLTGGAGQDVLFGGWGNDVLNGLMRNAAGPDTDSADFLNGGGDDDTLVIGAGDIATGGTGADLFMLGDWLVAGEAARIMDYIAEDDSLVLVWDDGAAGAAEPSITLGTDPDATDQTLVFMNGTVVASVNGTDLQPDDIALIPLSSAAQFGLAAA